MGGQSNTYGWMMMDGEVDIWMDAWGEQMDAWMRDGQVCEKMGGKIDR